MALHEFTRRGLKAYVAMLFATAVSFGLPMAAHPAAAAVAPSNDNFGAAEVLAASGSIVRSNVGATDQINEPSSIGGNALASVWFKWKAPASGMQQVDLIGSDPLVDPFLIVYDVPTGTPSLANLSEVAADDDGFGCSTLIPVVHFAAVAGHNYWFQVDTWAATSANLKLTWGNFRGAPPVSDSVLGAPTVATVPNVATVVTATNANATSDPALSEDPNVATLWYRVAVTGPTMMSFSVDSDVTNNQFGNPPAHALNIYDGPSPATAKVLAQTDNLSGSADFEQLTSATLWIQIESAVCEEGGFHLSVTDSPEVVTTGYTSQESAQLTAAATKINSTPQQLQHDSVGIIEFIFGIAGVSGPIVIPPPSSGPVLVTSGWPLSETSIITSLSNRWSGLSPSDTQKYASQIVVFLLSLS